MNGDVIILRQLIPVSLVGVVHTHCKVLERSGLSAVACADNVSNLMFLQIPKGNMDLAFPLSV